MRNKNKFLLFLSLLLFPLVRIFYIWMWFLFAHSNEGNWHDSASKRTKKKYMIRYLRTLFSSILLHIWLASRLNKYFLALWMKIIFAMCISFLPLFLRIWFYSFFSPFVYYCGKYISNSFCFFLFHHLYQCDHSTTSKCEMDRVISKQVAISFVTFFMRTILCVTYFYDLFLASQLCYKCSKNNYCAVYPIKNPFYYQLKFKIEYGRAKWIYQNDLHSQAIEFLFKIR